MPCNPWFFAIFNRNLERTAADTPSVPEFWKDVPAIDDSIWNFNKLTRITRFASHPSAV